MTGREYLYQLIHIENDIKDLKLRLERLEADLLSGDGISYDRERIMKSINVSAGEDKILRLIELKNEVNTKIVELEEERQKREHLINLVKDPISRRYLRLRYIEGFNNKQISKEMSLSHDHTRGYVKNKALEEFDLVFLQYLEGNNTKILT